MKKSNCLMFIMSLILMMTSCREMWGEHPLGNHLELWEGDTKEDRAIVYCEGDCHGGIYVVPTYAKLYDDGRHAEYVETAISDKKWVIVKTLRIKEKHENYWIINKGFDITNVNCSKTNCDSILQSHVVGPMNLPDLERQKRKLKITDIGF